MTKDLAFSIHLGNVTVESKRLNGQAVFDLASVPFSVVSFRATLFIRGNFDMIRRVQIRLDDGELVIFSLYTHYLIPLSSRAAYGFHSLPRNLASIAIAKVPLFPILRSALIRIVYLRLKVIPATCRNGPMLVVRAFD